MQGGTEDHIVNEEEWGETALFQEIPPLAFFGSGRSVSKCFLAESRKHIHKLETQTYEVCNFLFPWGMLQNTFGREFLKFPFIVTLPSSLKDERGESGRWAGIPAGRRLSDSAWLSQSLTETTGLCILTLPLGKDIWLFTRTDPKHPKTARYFV